MNLNLINKWCWEWSREDWVEAYKGFCKNPDAFGWGPMSKKEYYDKVTENHKRRKAMYEPTPPELLQKWIAGKRAAKEWARKRGCDMNGRLLSDIPPKDAVAIAERAEEIAIDTALKMSYYDRDKGRKTKWQNHS